MMRTLLLLCVLSNETCAIGEACSFLVYEVYGNCAKYVSMPEAKLLDILGATLCYFQMPLQLFNKDNAKGSFRLCMTFQYSYHFFCNLSNVKKGYNGKGNNFLH